MFKLKSRPWNLKENELTDEKIYKGRRQILKSLGVGSIAGSAMATSSFSLFSGKQAHAETTHPLADQFPAKNNPNFTLDREITQEQLATNYCNFYEFGSSKSITSEAQAMKITPWTLTIDGLVEKEQQVDVYDLIKKMNIEERNYRHRCVEAWAMAVPWTGFALKDLIKAMNPLSSAKYVRFETLADEKSMPGLSAFWYPWPYIEGLTMAEAMNDLTFVATGIYGKPLPKQNGAPLRLVLPWKYGFKSIKSIVKITFTDERPVSYWENIQGQEYGFWANVNPNVPHARWPQSHERLLGTDERVPTQLYNGYGDQVAHLYKDIKNEPLFM